MLYNNGAMAYFAWLPDMSYDSWSRTLAHMAAKGGVIAMSKQIAMEGGKHKIRCNTISPGLILTGQTKTFIDMRECDRLVKIAKFAAQ